MKFGLKAICLAGVLVTTAVYASTTLSPNQINNSGSIPSGHADLKFVLSNGNWVKNIYLPNTANHQDKITIQSSAGWKSYLDTSNTNLPIEVLEIQSGDTFQFVYDANLKKWVIQLAAISPTTNAQFEEIALNNTKLQHILLADGKWAKTIALPSNVSDGTLVQITSTATYPSEISKANLLFPSSFNLTQGSEYWLKYNAELQKWIPEFIKPVKINVKDIGASLSTVSAPVTEINFADANWVPNFTLPTTANDRDRIWIKSTATWSAKINNTNINSSATLALKTGDQYEFMFVSDKGHWVLMSAPIKMIEANSNIASVLPNMTEPTLKVKISNSNWRQTVNLPTTGQVGDKVILTSTADANSFVLAANGLSTTIKNGENRRFIFTSQGWTNDSHTIDMLFVNSPEVSSILGESAAKLRLIEGLNLTNVTAENSSAKFYLRQVGYITYKIPSATLTEALSVGRSDSTVQGERKRVLADGVYYQGNEAGNGGCGWAYVNASAYNMIGTNDVTGCSVAAMRHEIGHNLGLYHGDSSNIGSGFSHPLGSTALGGNNLNFYSSPYLYNPKYGVRLGEEGKKDAVSVINANAVRISQYN
ncbi:metalloendopeptidase CpaA [Acinetobacter sp. NIPH 1852]|uniref:metalloendopeptidase CpaA n=1 Tax=Acinetobacter sp. NIPH 1852 TaxID=2923428 RepID=UPI001F4AEAAA|nr:metalloendopeptidase CpaA [Acinetobacter sp. NIPH 1852]MCH7307340.1 metalloendopeptidase CpaA [Acinetobacter sp. NIPH 1852]